jgi:redox-sensitive bicupin YhaK (pirin superfamily)
MKSIVHKAESRGLADHGWLKSNHTFSFARHYDPTRMGFGLLRVLNDDVVAPGMGFGTHPHDNMEIISIPLSGALRHKDSTGNVFPIRTNDVQIMSAGSGLTHSEMNHSTKESVNFLQLWIFPKEKNITPRYEQKTFSPEKRHNTLLTVVAPDDQAAVWINQDAYLSLATLDQDVTLTYQAKKPGNGSYIFVLDGELDVADTHLGKRDAIGITDFDSVSLKATSPKAEVLVIDVPMK